LRDLSPSLVGITRPGSKGMISALKGTPIVESTIHKNSHRAHDVF